MAGFDSPIQVERAFLNVDSVQLLVSLANRRLSRIGDVGHIELTGQKPAAMPAMPAMPVMPVMLATR